MDFINRGAIQLSNIKYTCLDEADEMLNMGFKQDIEKIFLSLRKVVKTKPQNLLFSATMPDWIWSIAEKYQEKNFEYIDMIKDEIVKTSKTVEHYSFGTHFSEK